MSDRVDLALVHRGLAKSRSQAKLLVEERVVYCDGHLVTKASQIVNFENLEVRKAIQYVGRGAHKIEGAVSSFKIDLSSLVVADIGASTGGFTDYLLRNGVNKVYAVDVSYGQLDAGLCKNQNVINMEGINARKGVELPEKVDLVVVDVSFISLKLVFKNVFSILNDSGKLVALVKPQFEVGKGNLAKSGIVKDRSEHLKVLTDLFLWCESNNFNVVDIIRSSIKGKNGNEEYFFYFNNSLEKLEDWQNKIKILCEV